MKIYYKKLELFSVLYIYFSVLIFVGGWIRFAIAVPEFMLYIYVFYKRYFGALQDQNNFIFIEKKILALIFVGVVIWLVASGQGGFCSQASDWSKHNAILHDLIDYDWPVIYKLESGGALLSYYVASYLFPALIGKIGGFRWAEIAMLVQSVIGVLLVWLHLCYNLKIAKKAKQIALFVLLVVFGGVVLLGKGVYGYFRPIDLMESFHWFSKEIRIQYSSNIVSMRFVFPQCIVPWLATLLFLGNPDGIEDFAWIGVPVFLYSCFAFVGLLPFYIGKAFWLLIKDKNAVKWIRQIFSLQNIYALFCVMPIFIAYISGNVFQDKPDITNFHIINYSGNWVLYVCFCMSNFILYSLVIWKREFKNFSFYMANATLLILPFFWYGANNDLCMRACVPSFFVIAVLTYKYILNFQGKGVQYLGYIFCICMLCIAVVPSGRELIQNAKFLSLDGHYRKDDWGTLSGQLIRDGKHDKTAYNYVYYECEESFFIRYIARVEDDG